MTLLRADPGNPDLHPELMNACKINLIYDRQCEEERAGYLHRLVLETGEVEAFREKLVRCLCNAGHGDNGVDLVQVFEILCLAAERDETFDRDILRDFVLRTDDDALGLACVDSLVRLQGIDAFLACIGRFHTALAENVDEGGWLLRSAVRALVSRGGPTASTADLLRARSENAALDRLMSLNEIKDDTPQGPGARLDYAAVKAAMSWQQGLPYEWVRSATPGELAAIADDLAAEQDEEKQRAYLRVFIRRDFPRPPASIFHLARSQNPRVAIAAIWPLSRISHPDVRALALDLLAEGKRPELAVRPLRSNFQSGDFATIERLLDEAAANPDSCHRLGLAIIEVLRNPSVTPEESRDTLLRLYESEPCSLCRGSVVAGLVASGSVPEWMAEECRFDAATATADFFASDCPRSGGAG